MNQIIHPKIAKELGEVAHRQEIITGDYLNNEQKDAFKEIVNKFFPSEPQRAKILNPGSYIGSIILNWEKGFFGNPVTHYNIDWQEYIIGILVTGEARLKINVDTLELESIDASHYYFDGKTEYFLKLFEKEQDDGYNQKFCLLETFHNKVFLRKLYKISGFDSIAYGEEVPLGYLEETKDLLAALTIELDRLVLAKKVGLNTIKMVETIINSIDRKIAHNDHTIMDYGDVWTIIKGMDISHARIDPTDENSPIDMDKLGKILITAGDNQEGVQPGIEIVKNTYESITASLNIIESQFMQISSITSIPSFAFTNNVKSGNDNGTAKEKASIIFYKKIEGYHGVVKTLFQTFWDIIGEKEKNRVLEFQEIITTSAKDLLEIEEKKIENQKNKVVNGFASKKMALMELYDIDEKEADTILSQIKKEHDNTPQNIKASGDQSKE